MNPKFYQVGRQSFSSNLSSKFPGIHFVPNLLPEHIQGELLSRLLHRDLSDTRHLTNIHKHYRVPYEWFHSNTDAVASPRFPNSFFNALPNSPVLFEPLDPTIHKPINISQLLNKKLRWITLGGQYDWTNKRYPEEQPPAFPNDIANIVTQAFPEITPEAAIINVYSPGDTLSLHRDVSEVSDQNLVSISLGLEAIFIVGLEAHGSLTSDWIAVRVRSGDAICMSGRARYAWHGVPRIFSDTCPSWLRTWPACDSMQASNGEDWAEYEPWRNWMASKRVNLNVRQMFDR